MSDFDLIHSEYKQLARIARNNLATTQETYRRLELRNTITEMILDGNPEMEVFYRQASSQRKFNGLTYAEISELMTDGNAFEGGVRRESSRPLS